MVSKWPECRLEELAEPKGGSIAIGPFGSRLKAESYVNDGVAVIRGTNLGPGTPLVGEFVYITPEKASELGNANLKASDLVFPHRGAIGEVGIVPNDGRPYVLSTSLMKISLDQARAIPEFYYLFFKSSRGQAELLKNASQVGTPGIATPLKSLRQCVVPCPTMEEQFDAVDALLSIDSRIKNLRQTNAILEAIAQALFKSWFVDFDPVRAKAEGREPEGMDAATAALFPSEFEDSELGPIPKGWRVDEIGRVVACVGGATPSTKEESFWIDGTHHWATPKDLSGLQAPILTTTERLITDTAVARISSALLPAGTLLMSSRAPIGYLAIAAVPTAINQGFIAMPPGGQLPPSYLLFWARLNMELIKQKGNGSTFMEISKAAFRPIKVCVPSPQAIAAFEIITGPLLKRIELNEYHAAALTQARDTLLPRLISGKLRLPEAERETEAALA